MDGVLGPERAAAVMRRAGLAGLPDGTAMIPEEDVRRLHSALRAEAPAAADAVQRAAGLRTGDYILAHRIPMPARRLLRMLPAPFSARLLTSAIGRNAWTFAGSGAFRALGPRCYAIVDNPLIRGERADRPLCAWHAGVFERLHDALVAPGSRCVETDCAAQTGGSDCRFTIEVTAERASPERATWRIGHNFAAMDGEGSPLAGDAGGNRSAHRPVGVAKMQQKW